MTNDYCSKCNTIEPEDNTDVCWQCNCKPKIKPIDFNVLDQKLTELLIRYNIYLEPNTKEIK